MTLRFDGDLRARIAANITAHPRRAQAADGLRRAAVVIALVPGDNGATAFVLTRRASSLRAHSRQYALPGGRVDPGETATDAARREAFEEVGLELREDDVLGLLDDYRTRSGYVITPVVAWASDATRLAPAPGEVDAVMRIGIDELVRPDSPRWVDIPESSHRVLQLPLRNRLIHAPTGALLWQFREVAMHGELVRTDGVEEPRWAWR